MEEFIQPMSQLEEIIEPSNEKENVPKEIKKSSQICYSFYLDFFIGISLITLSFFSISYINFINVIFGYYLLYTHIDSYQSYILHLKKKALLILLILNIIYLIIVIIIWIQDINKIAKYFLLSKENNFYSAFNLGIVLADILLYLIFLLFSNFHKESWLSLQYKDILKFLKKCKKFKNPILSFGIYSITIGTCINPTTINFCVILIVFTHFGTLIFSKNIHSILKRPISITFLILIPVDYLFNYAANLEGIRQNLKENIGILGLVKFHYEEQKIGILDLSYYSFFQFNLLTLGFCSINVYYRCRDLRGGEGDGEKGKEAHVIYNNDVDHAIVVFLNEASGLGIFSKIKLFVLKYCYSPSFFLHFCRIGIIVYVNLYQTYFSPMYMIWLLVSMLLSEDKEIKSKGKNILVLITKFTIFPLQIVSYCLSYFSNISGIRSTKKEFGMEKFELGGKVFLHMSIQMTIVTTIQMYVHVQIKYDQYRATNLSSQVVTEQQKKLVTKEIEHSKMNSYILKPIEIIFKFALIALDIFLIVFLFLSISQSINLFNEIILLFIISLVIFSQYMGKWYKVALIAISISLQLKYLIFLIFSNQSNEENTTNISYNVLSLLFYDELKSQYFYWIAVYLLFINSGNQESELLKTYRAKTFSIYELIEHKFSQHPNLLFVLNTICDFAFGIYIWLLIPSVLICLLLQDNNIIFLVELVIIFLIYYKYIKIASDKYQNHENIFLYTWILNISSIMMLCIIYIFQFLNKKPFNIWFTLTSPSKMKHLELIGLFMFAGNYTSNFMGYMMTFIFSIAIHVEIERQIYLNTMGREIILNTQKHKRVGLTKNVYLKKVYKILDYILHYFWIVMFIVVAILSIHWMISISMAIQLIVFCCFLMRSFLGYYNCTVKPNGNKRTNLKEQLRLYTKQKTKYFEITKDIQKEYFDLIWIFTFGFIGFTYLSGIFLKLLDNQEMINLFSAIFYFMGAYSTNEDEKTRLKFIEFSWGYFIIVALFSFRAYFESKLAELRVKSEISRKKSKNRKAHQMQKSNFRKRISSKRKTTVRIEPKNQLIPFDELTIPIDINNQNDNADKVANNKKNKLQKRKSIEIEMDNNLDLINDRFTDVNVVEEPNDDYLGNLIDDEEDEDDLFEVIIRPRSNSDVERIHKELCDFDQSRGQSVDSSRLAFPNLFTQRTTSYQNSPDLALHQSFSLVTSNNNSNNVSFINIREDDNKKTRDDTNIEYRAHKSKLITYSLNIYLFFKSFTELLIIILILISAAIKMNIISFVLLSFIIIIYRNKTINTRIMFKLSYVINILFIVQYILFVTNVSYETNPFIDNVVLKHIEERFHIPWYPKIGSKWGIFFSCGVVRHQINSLWLDVIILILLYFYLEFFSFSIYEQNLKKKINYEEYNMKFYNLFIGELLNLERIIRYRKFVRAMKLSYDINLEQAKKSDIKAISLDFYADKKAKIKLKKTKRLKAYKHIRSYFYLSFHYICLILILIISASDRGVISFGYIIFSMVYIYKASAFLIGRTWTFERGLIFFFKPYLFFDLITQFLFQIPFDFLRLGTNCLDDIFDIFGYVRVINYSSKEDFINTSGLIHILLKITMFFVFLIQEVIYTSPDFKKFILKYHLDYMQKAFIKGKLHSFLFNNYRIKMMNDRLEEGKVINNTLKNIESMLIKWNDKLTNQKGIKRNESDEDIGKFEVKNSKKFKKLEMFSKIGLLKKHWYIKLALTVYEDSRRLNNEKIRNKKEIISIMRGQLMMKSSLENLIDKFDRENNYPLMEKIKNMKTRKSYEVRDSIIELPDEEEKEKHEENNKIDHSPQLNDIVKLDDNNVLNQSEFTLREKNDDFNSFNEVLIEDDENKEGNANLIEEAPLIKKESRRRRTLLRMSKEFFDLESFFASCEYYELKAKIRQDFFSKYCSKGRIVLIIFQSLSCYLKENFEYICYFFMILNHFMNASVASFFWAFMVFIFGLTQYPRPGKIFWMICLFYCSTIIFIKAFIQMKFWGLIFDFSKSQNDKETLNSMSYRLGIKHCSKNGEFLSYIVYDFILFSLLLINQFMLIRKGLWDFIETDYETIEEANERIKKYKGKKYENFYKNDEEELTNNEIVKMFGKMKAEEAKNIKQSISDYYFKNFTNVRNEKPGKDYYTQYTIFLIIILIYIIFAYTKMDQDKLIYNIDSFKLKQFSGNMVLFALFHLFLLVVDRSIYLKNARKVKKVAFKVYNVQTGEDVTAKLRIDNYKEAMERCEEDNDYEFVMFQFEGSQFGLISKFLLQLCTVLIIHSIIFYYFPKKGNQNLQINDTDNEFLSNPYLIFFYLLYCIYFTFSSLQIKYGLADIRKKSSLMNGSNILNSLIFKIYKAIPFLFELKNFIDWTFTTTSFDIFKWLKYEEIYSLLFINRCFAKSYFGRRVGSKITVLMKVLLGGSAVFGILLVLFVPLVLFSTLNPSKIPNYIIGGKLKVQLNFVNFNQGSEVDSNKNHEMNLTLAKITNLEITNYTQTSFQDKYGKDPTTNVYQYGQVQKIKFKSFGENNWDISSKAFDHLSSSLNYANSHPDELKVYLILKYNFYKKYESQISLEGYQEYEIPNSKLPDFFKNIINCNDTVDKCNIWNLEGITFNIEKFYYSVLHVPSDTKSKQLLETKNNTKFQLIVESNNENRNLYWEITNQNGNDGIEFDTFSDFYSVATFGYDVLTFYTAFIILIGQLLRGGLLGEAERVIYTEMVKPEKLMNVCEGIRISRIKKNFLQEDRLYYLLIDLMRSPEIVKSLTKSSLVYLQKGNIIQKEDRKDEPTESIPLKEKFDQTKRKAFI